MLPCVSGHPRSSERLFKAGGTRPRSRSHQAGHLRWAPCILPCHLASLLKRVYSEADADIAIIATVALTTWILDWVLETMTNDVVMPASAEIEELSRALRHLEDGQPVRLVLATGERVTLPAAAGSAVRQVLEAIAQGKGVAVGSYETDLTTQQAADLLGMSRQHLVNLLNEGELPHHRVGTHRRVRLEDVMDFRERRRQHRAEKLDELTQLSQDADPAGYH